MFQRYARLTLLALVATLIGGVATAAAQPNVIGQWSAVQSLPYFPVHSHLLPTGKVMLWPGDGGVSGDDATAWDPATQSLSPLSKAGYDLFCSGHAFLADGTLFVAGGHIQNYVGLSTATAYDGFRNVWRYFPNMNAGRWYPTATVLPSGDVLVVSGDVDMTIGINTLPQVFQVSTGTWHDLTSAQLGMDLYPQMFVAPNGKVFNSGPTGTTRYLDTSGTGVWTVVANRPGPERTYGSAVMYEPGKILVMGGGDPPTNTAAVIDLNAPSPAWRAVGSMSFARRQLNAVLLPDGKVLVTGGTSGPGFNNASFPVYAAELWDPTTEQWTVMAEASIPRLYHSGGLLLPDGRILSTGGNGYPQPEIYSPPYLFKGARPTITSTPATIAYGQSFTIDTPDAASIGKVTLIRLPSVTHAFDQNQRLNSLSFSTLASGVTAVAPAAAALAPPGHYMLFVVNTAGVPSVAQIIQLGGAVSPPEQSCPCSIWNLSDTPTTASHDDAQAVELGVRFRSDIDGYITGLRFYKGAQNTGTHVGNLWTATGTLLASATFTGETASGWQEVTLNAPVAITANTSYIASYHTNTGYYSVSRPYFGSAQNSHPLRALADGQDGPNGVYKYGASGFPTSTWQSTNYWVDVVFTPTVGSPPPPPPPSAPSLTALTPNSARAGDPAFTLGVTGTGFVNGTTVLWNGAPRSTTFVSTTQLTAAIPATDIAAVGTAQITVVDPEGAASNALPFSITNAPPSSFTLTVAKSGAGAVTSSPAGISCGADCSQAYTGGTTVTLTATPNKNAVFQGWSGACSGTGACTLTMDDHKSVTATFGRRR